MIIPEDDGVDMTKGLLFYCLEGDIIRKLCGGGAPQFSTSNLPNIVLEIEVHLGEAEWSVGSLRLICRFIL